MKDQKDKQWRFTVTKSSKAGVFAHIHQGCICKWRALYINDSKHEVF